MKKRDAKNFLFYFISKYIYYTYIVYILQNKLKFELRIFPQREIYHYIYCTLYIMHIIYIIQKVYIMCKM